MDIHYRLATVADAALLVENRIAFLQEISGPSDAAKVNGLRMSLLKYFETAIADGSYICWIATVDDNIAGTGAVVIRIQPANFRCPTGRIGYIMNMYTNSSYRRLGIGSAILEKLIAIAKDLGLDLLELHATADSEPLYRAHGFAEPKSIVLEKRTVLSE